MLFGVAGLCVDLLLLKHYETVLHAIPVVLLAAALAVTVAAAARPGPRTLALFRAAMALCVILGVGGVGLHLRGNLAWALERDETLGGWPLLWNAIRGATPLLAPGALAQIGLLGLIFTYHHPALARGAHHDQEIR